MHEAEISNEVLAVDRADHELSLPELLIVGDVIMAGFTFADLEKGPVTVEGYLDIFELLGVNLLELEDQPLRWDLESFQVHESSLQIAAAVAADVTQLDLSQLGLVALELIENVFSDSCNCEIRHGAELDELCRRLVHAADLELGTQRRATLHRNGFVDELSDELDNNVRVLLQADDEVAGRHHGIQIFVPVVIVVAHSVDLCKLPDGFDELVSGAGKLWLEEREPKDLRVDALGEDLADLAL